MGRPGAEEENWFFGRVSFVGGRKDKPRPPRPHPPSNLITVIVTVFALGKICASVENCSSLGKHRQRGCSIPFIREKRRGL